MGFSLGGFIKGAVGGGLSAAPTGNPWLIGGAALLGGITGNEADRKAKSQASRNRETALGQASPENFLANFNKVLPGLEQAAARTVGPQVQSGVATLNARRDQSGTGIGQALASGAQAAPGIFAANQAASVASGLSGFGTHAAVGTQTPPGTGVSGFPATDVLTSGLSLFNLLRGGGGGAIPTPALFPRGGTSRIGTLPSAGPPALLGTPPPVPRTATGPILPFGFRGG